MPKRPVILVTGFEPFGGSRLNPSREALAGLVANAPRGIDVRTEVLPVVGGRGRGAAPPRLAAAVRRHAPSILLCLGETGARGSICVERVAINLRDYRIPDNAGAKVRDEPVLRAAPTAMMSTLPVRALVTAMRRSGAPCELSLSAGAFLCNEVMFHALALARKRRMIAAGFIHLPRLPEQARGRRSRRGAAARSRSSALSLSLSITVPALVAALAVLRRTARSGSRPTTRRGASRSTRRRVD